MRTRQRRLANQMEIRVTAVALSLMLFGLLFSTVGGSAETGQGSSDDDGRAEVAEPFFAITLRGVSLRLQGRTESTDHERRLLQMAARLFPGREIDTKFRTAGSVPAQWQSTTVSLLEALSAMRSGRATLTDRTLNIRGIGTDDWQRQLEALLPALPRSMETDVEVLIPDVDPVRREYCERAFAARRHGAVSFEESGTSFRNSAYPVLDRIVSLADACRDSNLAITGHTDSSGDETWNLRLSIARAEAVADYLAAKGIARNRLLVNGAGSAVPVADNSTRYGRSLNRRIEIEMQRHAAED